MIPAYVKYLRHTCASEYETVENWSEAACLHLAGKGLEHKDLTSSIMSLQPLQALPALSCCQLCSSVGCQGQVGTPRHPREQAEVSPGRSWTQLFNRNTVISLGGYLTVFQKSKLKKGNKRSSNPEARAGNVRMIRARSVASGWGTNFRPDEDWTVGLFCHLGCLPSLTWHQEKHKGLHVCRITALRNRGCYKERNLWSVSFLGSA